MSPVTAEPVVNLNPGPVPLADRTRDAMLGPLVSHRSPEFEAIFRDCRTQLQEVFRTEHELLIVNGNGNLGLETGIANCVRPGDTVLCLTNGKFGDNLVAMASRHTGDVQVVEREWGESFSIDELTTAIVGDVDAVAMTHCETSTGLINPVHQVAELADDHGVLSIVDTVSGVGVERLPVDDWNIDLAITASQKCLSAPPGLSVLSISQLARERRRENPKTMPYNLDFDRYLSAASRDQTPSTAPVHTYRALRQSLSDILDVGLASYMATQARRAEAIREAAAGMGLEVFPTANHVSKPSDSVTSLELPAGMDAAEVVSALQGRGVLVSTGIGPIADRTIRLATMSNAITDDDVLVAVRELQSVVESLTDMTDLEGLSAAEAVLESPPKS